MFATFVAIYFPINVKNPSECSIFFARTLRIFFAEVNTYVGSLESLHKKQQMYLCIICVDYYVCGEIIMYICGLNRGDG